MQTTIKGIKIHSIATALPPDIEELSELDMIFGEEEISRIIKTNGIERIRKAPEGLCASDMCVAATNLILNSESVKESNISNEIDGIVFVSQTPDYILPATSCTLQKRLGLSKNSVAIDINHGCSGYIYGLYQASMMVAAGGCRSVLMCAGDVLSCYVNPLDKNERMVFGDAGSATLITRGDGQIGFAFHTDGSGAEHLIIPSGGSRQPRSDETAQVNMRPDGGLRSDEELFINGIEVMNFALREVPKAVTQALEAVGWSKEEVTLFGLHQANKFIVDYLRKILKVPALKVPVAMKDTGNTSAASIPLMLCQERDRFVNDEMLTKSILCGFGVGFSCGVAALDLSDVNIFEPIEINF
ncbi:MAG: ketoacyl-ACP synthase III [Desulfamplus sp.]|nr:ketoacyl-ACP synthase III [Desulfamplus sp.]